MVNTTSCENKYRTLGNAFQSDFAPGFGDTKICAHDTTGQGRDSCQVSDTCERLPFRIGDGTKGVEYLRLRPFFDKTASVNRDVQAYF